MDKTVQAMIATSCMTSLGLSVLIAEKLGVAIPSDVKEILDVLQDGLDTLMKEHKEDTC